MKVVWKELRFGRLLLPQDVIPVTRRDVGLKMARAARKAMHYTITILTVYIRL